MSNEKGWQTGLVIFSTGVFNLFKRLEDLQAKQKAQLEKQIGKLRCIGVLACDEFISRVFEECVGLQSFSVWLDEIQRAVKKKDGTVVIPLDSREVYEEITGFLRYVPHPRLKSEEGDVVCWCKFSHEAKVHTKYKCVGKKVKPMATQLPEDSEKQMELVAKDPILRDVCKIGHHFTHETLERLKIGGGDFLTEVEKEKFEKMIWSHGKAFSFSAEDRLC
ncbi:hypothetical protein R1flu_010585 [Riccia fluitans]|uniref:Uncharacterized protein n=1 Tax=Riccia fluitans TaxID=41844 RepID=A0ABD1Z5I9_9MARC